MVVAIERLGHEFGDQGVGQMAVHAGRGDVMARLHPRIVFRIHDVAVGAGLGIGGEIGETLGIDEGEKAEAEQHAESDSAEDKDLPGEVHHRELSFAVKAGNALDLLGPHQLGVEPFELLGAFEHLVFECQVEGGQLVAVRVDDAVGARDRLAGEDHERHAG